MAKSKKPTKIEIAYAHRSLAETRDYAEELRSLEGNRGAHAFLASVDCAWRCAHCITILRNAGQNLPDWLTSNLGYYRTLRWL